MEETDKLLELAQKRTNRLKKKGINNTHTAFIEHDIKNGRYPVPVDTLFLLVKKHYKKMSHDEYISQLDLILERKFDERKKLWYCYINICNFTIANLISDVHDLE